MDNNNASTLTMRGTSMATPIVSGNAALVREYFRRGFYPTGTPNKENEMKSPSSSLIRGAIVHSATPLNGNVNYDYKGNVLDLSKESYPNAWNGYGLMTLQNVLYFPESNFKLFVKDRIEISNEKSDKFCVKFKKASGSVKVTLVWNDPPSTPYAAVSLINNLDLLVYDQHEHFGNNRVDTRNTVEQVLIPEVKFNQTITIIVKGTHIPVGPQKYTLIITGNDFEMVDECEIPFVIFSLGFLFDIFSYTSFALIFIGLIIGLCIFLVSRIIKNKSNKLQRINPLSETDETQMIQRSELESQINQQETELEENVYFE
jgi:hypothetical protein